MHIQFLSSIRTRFPVTLDSLYCTHKNDFVGLYDSQNFFSPLFHPIKKSTISNDFKVQSVF